MWTPAAGLALSALVLLASGCSTSASCTELDCQSEAIVTFPAALVAGSYDLVIEGTDGPATATLRCRDPGSPEAAENPEGITCDETGFTLEGHALADEREVRVTVIPTDGSDQASALVRLEAVDEITPNGPDCPPLCVVRNGQFVVAET